MITSSDLRTASATFGFELVGVAPIEPMGGGWYAPHAERLRAWIKAGHHADMEWIVERVEARLVPQTLMPEARRAIVLWLPSRTAPFERPPGVVGQVASYAWGRDYHNVGRKAVRKMLRWLREAVPGIRTYVSVDTGAILERAFGERAGVGWIGKSMMLINPKLGTYGSLAVIFVDAELEVEVDSHPFRCGTCTDCVDACPTGAITADGVDSRRCISYWTIEHRGVIPVEIRPLLGNWVFGCDVCQDVCPWNRKVAPADPGIWRPHADRAWPDLAKWVATPSAELYARLEGSPLRRARGEGLRRNALICLANGRHTSALPVVEAATCDPDPTVRATAIWAAQVLRDCQQGSTPGTPHINK